jgi:hypothetical protein
MGEPENNTASKFYQSRIYLGVTKEFRKHDTTPWFHLPLLFQASGQHYIEVC